MEPRIAEVLKSLRAERGWGYEELAQKMEAPGKRSLLHQIETGKIKDPRASTIQMLAKAFGVPPGIFFESTEKGNGLEGLEVPASFYPYFRMALKAYKAQVPVDALLPIIDAWSVKPFNET